MTKANQPSQRLRFWKSFICVTLVTFFYAFSAKAQLVNMPVTGYNADVVGDGAGVGTSSTSADVDGAGWIFVNSTFNPGAGVCATGTTALPATNLISSLTTPGLTYSLQPYNANNSLRLTTGTSGTLTLVTPTSAANIYLLALGGSGACTITATVNFSDGTTQVISGSAADWCGGVSPATSVFYRISRTATTCTGGTCQYLYDVNLAISPANYAKTITSILVANTGGILNVMGVGALLPCSGTPTPGNTITSSNPACPSTNFTLSLQNNSGGGATYQWQSSPDGITWTNISGATLSTRAVSQTVSTYYQCVVTCGGNTGTSNPVFVTMAVPLNGTYTVNSGVASGGTNFQTFGALRDVLNCAGVSGPVIVNVVSGTGPYTEQIQFNVIPGMSAVNTVTINGNGNILTYAASVSTAPGTLVFNGTDYMRVNNLTVTGTGGTYALACHLYNQADNNIFTGCTFNVPANCTNTTQVPFSISGSATSATTAGVSGINNVVTGCTMFSGYYNTCFVGNSAGVSTGNQLINSNILDQYFYGSYNLYQNGMIISGNTLQRPTRTTLSTFYGIYISTSCTNMLVEKNKIRNPFGTATTNTNTAYGVYNVVASTSGNENKIYNNLVSDMNSSGTIYGIYVNSYNKVYHNTVALDQTAATGTTTTYAIYCTSGTGSDVRNNIVSVRRGGTGSKYCLYYSSTPATSNNNDVFMNSAAGTNYVAYNGTSYATLAAWQTATSKDLSSQSVNPSYVAPGSYDYTPTASSINDIGAALGILTDITGAARSATTPDPGCYEFSVGACAGTPTPGNTIASSNPACASATLVLSLQNLTLGSGVTYQWQTSPDGITWTNVGSGGNSSTYSLSQTTPTYYKCIVTCTTGPSTGTSTPVLVGQNPVSACYCTPATTGGTTYYISNFLTTGGASNINNTSVGSATGYQNFYSTVGMSALQNSTVNFTMTLGGGSTYGKAIWVDWNQDGAFSAGEQVASSTAYVASPITGSFTVPITATSGTTRMRILTSFTPSNPSDPCTNSGSGEYEDYAFTVIPLVPCSGTPAPGNTIANTSLACANVGFTLSLQNFTNGSGVTYQWQSSPDGIAWSNVSGATSSTYTTSQTVTTYYQCAVTCSASSTTISNPLMIGMDVVSNCYCANTGGTSTYYISNFTTTVGTTNINNTSGFSTNGYGNYLAMSASQMQGQTINFSITGAGSTYGFGIWVDWNQNGSFADAGEQMYNSGAYLASTTGSFTVPITALPGNTRMRVVENYLSATPTACTGTAYTECEDYTFTVIALPNCSGPPASVTAALSVPGNICGTSGSKTIVLSGISPASGLTYQWQESSTGLAGSFVNVTTGTGGTTNTFTTATISTSMYYQCIVGCSFGAGTTTSSSVQAVISPNPVVTVTPASGTNVCSGSNVDLSASGAVNYTWACNPGITGYPMVSLLSTPNNLAKVTARPTSTLATSTAAPPTTTATPTWIYTVTGTDAGGCTATTAVTLNVITTAVVPLTLTYASTPDPVCAPGTAVTLTVNNNGTIGAGQWVYNWYNNAGTTLLQTTTNSLTSNSYTPSVAVANGNQAFTVKVSNTVCPSSYAVASPSYYVGFTSLNVATNSNCGDNGQIAVYPEGQTDFTDWYVNNFNTGLLGPAFDAAFGNTSFTGGLCNITPMALSQTGTLLVRNPANINTNNLQVDFLLSTAPLGFAYNILGADGMAWSYAADVYQGSGAGPGFQAESGSGTGFKLAFDATANGPQNTPGCYLMYNCTTPDQGPSSPGVIAFKQGSFWQGLVNAPVSIQISDNGYVTVKINNQVIFDHVPLPTAYLTANKSTWIHAFTARTGGSDELHAIDNLKIRYNAFEYSNNSTNGSDGSWQTENVFTGLAAGTYPIWVRKLNDPTCFSFTGNAIINVDPSPSSASTVASPGYSNVVCYGNSTSLTSSIFVPGAVFYWEQSSSLGGPWTAASGTNSNASYITPGLTTNTYYRLTFTCPNSSPIVATPMLVTVNAGTIASTNSPQLVNCLGDNVTVTAVPGANTTCVWYASASGGSPLAAGNSYTAVPASLPITYYVEPVTTIYSNHYYNGGQTVIANTFGTAGSGTGIATVFSTTASVTIDSIKVLPSATGTLNVALQIAGSSTNIGSVNFTVTAAMVGNFVNVPVNLIVPGTGNFQLTTNGVACSYYSSYSGSYAANYMSMGGVFTVTGGALSATSAGSTIYYGTAFRIGISSSCPVGNGARTPVVVQANPANAVNIATSTTSTCAGVVQSLTASSLAAYSNYSWTPITDLFIDSAATIPYPAGNNSIKVYMKASTGGSKTYTTSTVGSGCTNTASATINVVAGPTVFMSASPSAVCLGNNVQLNASTSTSGVYCTPSYSTGTTAGDYCTLVSIASTTLNNATGASASPYYTLYPASGSTTASLLAGNTYTITLVAGTFTNNDFAAWIDYNHNGDLATSGEKLGEVDNIGASPVSTTIVFTVPLTAYNGPARLRIREADQSTTGGMDPCVAYSFGETEDYIVNITGGITAAGFAYNWSSNATYLNATNVGNPIAQSVTTPQTYTVVVTDVSTTCSNTGTVAVTVKLPSASTSSTTSCNSYLWNGTSYTTNGTYTYTTANSVGCDSVATLNLTIHHSTTSSTSAIFCGSYSWNGNTYTSAGTYTYTTANSVGCDSVSTLNLTMACNSILNLTMYIQGYWDAGSSMMLPVLINQGESSTATACDSIDVELHSSIAPYGTVQTMRTILNQNGTANCIFTALLPDNYYVAIKHRNGVQTWSATPIAISNTLAAGYDFSTAATQAYGDNQVEVSTGVWAFFSGDIVVDENVDLLDLGYLENDISSFAYGYLSSDLNGDGNVDLLDSPILEENISNFIFSSHP